MNRGNWALFAAAATGVQVGSAIVATRTDTATRGTGGAGTALDRTAASVTISISWLIASSQSSPANFSTH